MAEEGVPFREIASAIGRRLGVPVARRASEEAGAWFTLFAGMDVPASSEATRRLLGWAPAQCTLLEDVASARYFPELCRPGLAGDDKP